MNNLSVATSHVEDNKTDPKKIKRSRKSKHPKDEVRTVRIFANTLSKIDELIEESKRDGISRIQARHLIEFGIRKITSNDLEKLRKDTATTEDKFEERLKEFQKSNPSATKESFLEHLLTQAKANL